LATRSQPTIFLRRQHRAGQSRRRYLRDNGVEVRDFNAYGARRGNHEVMMRGNSGQPADPQPVGSDIEGGVTRFLPDGQPDPIYEASMRYQEQGTDLVIIAGKEYGTGSSRDWAAKGTRLLGVKAVLAESYERIHRSNLVGMGILPLQFVSGDTWQSLGLTGEEILTLADPNTALRPGQMMTLKITDTAGAADINVNARLDSQMEIF
jgi:aconitate hydratase